MCFHRIKFGTLFLSVLLMILSACQQVNAPNRSINIINESNIKVKTSLKGTAEFPQSGRFAAKAVLADITTSTTVSIINPVTNVTIATGLTDPDGAFTLNPDTNFRPSTGDIFILEASKRLEGGGVGKTLAAIRTFIQWQDEGWGSITASEVNINIKTTALAIMSGLNPSASKADFINKIDASGTIGTVNEQITPAKADEVIFLVNLVLEKNQDPVKYISLGSSGYIIVNPPDFSPT
jgi:hypothetical protein